MEWIYFFQIEKNENEINLSMETMELASMVYLIPMGVHMLRVYMQIHVSPNQIYAKGLSL